jgi:hypothetical protein
MWGFSLLHLLAFSVVWYLSPGIFHKQHKVYQEIVFGTETRALLKEIKPYIYDFALATPSYAQSAILGYHAHRHVLVFGDGSYHARQDDMLTDYAKLDKQGIAILSYKADVTKKYARYFNAFNQIIIPLHGTRFHLGVGIGFKYDLYKKEVIDKIKAQYYHIPSWLPHGPCYMDAY